MSSYCSMSSSDLSGLHFISAQNLPFLGRNVAKVNILSITLKTKVCSSNGIHSVAPLTDRQYSL